MSSYIVTDTELTGIANAIRNRSGMSSQLIFPTGFVSAVEEIPNVYGANDQGKVVSGDELVAQTSVNVTQNGTIDTTTINAVTVDIQYDDYDLMRW